MSSKKTAPKLADFEKSLNELESLVEKMEGGETSLEDAMKDFERGIELTRQCQNLLKNAELKVQKLIADTRNTDADLADFEPAADN